VAAVLRASGPDFNVDAFVASSEWRFTSVFRRHTPAPPAPRPACRRPEGSGFNVAVSNAGLHDFPQQLADAVAFLTERGDEVRALVNFPGVSSVVLDFAVAWRDVAAQSDQFPARLVGLAGACGIALELSHYPVSDGESGPG
jgi:hypothetical protein